jgi:hypothetical protein
VIHYNLGWAFLSLKKYSYGISQMKKCIRLEPRCTPFAKWNIACGLKMLNRDDDALKTLEEISPGPWWKNIANDDWFKDPTNTPFMAHFEAICLSKLNDTDAH